MDRSRVRGGAPLRPQEGAITHPFGCDGLTSLWPRRIAPWLDQRTTGSNTRYRIHAATVVALGLWCTPSPWW